MMNGIVKMGVLLTLIIGMAASDSQGQITINALTDSIKVTGTWSVSGPITFTNTQPRYTPGVTRFGIQFHNQTFNSINNTIDIANLNGSPILGAHGPGTIVEYNGNLTSNGGRSFPSLAAINGGVVRLGANARTNLVLPGSYFTRQFWCYGDGTGTIEFDSAFVADHTQLGTVADGLGSIRLSNCNLLTHSTKSLPKGYRPNGLSGGPLINAHLVFDDRPNSKWTTASYAQEYVGGLWVQSSQVYVQNLTNLTLSGARSVWSDYINWGGLIFQKRNATLTKTGGAELLLSGDQGYTDSSRIIVKAGTLNLKSLTYDSLFADFYNTNSTQPDLGNHLQLVIDSVGAVKTQISQRMKSLTMFGNNTQLEMVLGNSIKADTIMLNGMLSLVAPPNYDPQRPFATLPDSIVVFTSPVLAGQLSAINLPPVNFPWSFRTDSLLTKGYIQLYLNGSVTKAQAVQPLKLSPNPATELIEVELPVMNAAPTGNEGVEVYLYDQLGKRVPVQPLISDASRLRLSITHLPSGVYHLICKKNKVDFYGKLVK